MSVKRGCLLILLLGVVGAAPAWAQAPGAAEHAGWLSLAPPGAAIAAALILRAALPALFLGVWLGAWIVGGLGLSGLVSGLFDTVLVYVFEAVTDAEHVAILLFTLMIGGLIGIVSNNGGTLGVVNAITRRTTSRQHGQLATILFGLVLFVDDYANTLVVGNTMRPITDRLKISREKLAYLVDSTAAPVATVAVITTWVGYQVGLIGDAVESIDSLDTQPYLLFLDSIAYSFYPWLCIVLLLIVAWTGRDIGPMVEAERKAALDSETPETAAGAGAENDGRAINAIVPIVVLVAGIAIGLVSTGEGDSLREIIGSADSYAALMWAAVAAVLVAVGMPLAQRAATLGELLGHWLEGVRSLTIPVTIIVLAWSLAATTDDLGTAEFIVSMVGDSLPVELLPAVVFSTAAAIAFATGAAWGTMAILIPLVVPLAWSLLQAGGTPDPQLLAASVAAVLSGAVFGDHCSPISDTTVMSSMASGCDHIAHVRTQLPYALLAGSTAFFVCALPTGFGLPWWGALPLGAGVLALAMKILGRRA